MKKKKNVLIYVGLVVFLITLVGISYAMYTFIGTGTTENIITTGQITVAFEEKNNILIKNRYPETDAVGLANTDEKSQMTFTVSSDIVGDAIVDYAVGLVDIKEGATLTQEDIKIYLTKNGEVANGFTTGVGKTVENFKNAKIEGFLDSHMIAQGSLTKTQMDTYDLKAWINETYKLPKDESMATDENGGLVTTISEEFSFKIKVVSTNLQTYTLTKPNAPVLASNMIPVIYDSANDTWVKADKTNTNDSWYNYENKIWANAVTVTESNGTRSDLVDAPVGTPIPMERINTMMVWIPRFSAEIPTIDCSKIVNPTIEEYPICYHLTITDEEIDALINGYGIPEPAVQGLLNGETVEGLDLEGAINLYNKQENLSNPINPVMEYNPSYIGDTKSFDVEFKTVEEKSHDAFTFGNEELEGFWIGKFETSHSTLSGSRTANNLGCTNEACENAKGIEILPNKVSLRRNNVSNFFYASRSMEQTGNPYGFNKTKDTTIDTHMIKNNEWGAVAYLTYSIYGRCTSLTNCTLIGINNNADFVTGNGAPARTPGNHYMPSYIAPQPYNTIQGMDASTTGNIYGVYDMSGGAEDYVMGVYKPTQLTNISDKSGFSSSTSNSQYDLLPNTKYYNVYTTESEYPNAGLQHALIETSGWYGDGAGFVVSDYPWFLRGGYMYDMHYAGVFSFRNTEGLGGEYIASRISITID